MSKIIAQLKIAYPYYFRDLKADEALALIEIYRENINYPYEIANKSIKNIIRRNKYMPSVAEIVEECEEVQKQNKYEVIEIMKQNNYFANSNEIEKAKKFIDENIIPDWLKKDMELFGKGVLLQIS